MPLRLSSDACTKSGLLSPHTRIPIILTHMRTSKKFGPIFISSLKFC